MAWSREIPDPGIGRLFGIVRAGHPTLAPKNFPPKILAMDYAGRGISGGGKPPYAPFSMGLQSFPPKGSFSQAGSPQFHERAEDTSTSRRLHAPVVSESGVSQDLSDAGKLDHFTGESNTPASCASERSPRAKSLIDFQVKTLIGFTKIRDIQDHRELSASVREFSVRRIESITRQPRRSLLPHRDREAFGIRHLNGG